MYDYNQTVIKSDSLIPESLWKELSDGVKLLEDVPDDRKDWHPGSNKQVLDLVHPSLWPLVYGRSRVVNERIGTNDALQACGKGDVAAIPQGETRRELSKRFQWLPCDVTIDDARIQSYINNLHPVEHAALYPVIEKFIQKSLPAWDAIYRWHRDFNRQRLKTSEACTECTTKDVCEGSWECRASSRPVDADEPARVEDEEYEPGYEGSERETRDMAWFMSTHPAKLPDITPDQPQFGVDRADIRTQGFFGTDKVQVIVKLANIVLTPENPEYPGGTWHVEGQQNEHICATALFYYDCDNITDSYLAFRTRADAEGLCTALDYGQNDDLSIERTLAIDSQGSTMQDIGRVLTRERRAVFFPNVYMHQVQPFELIDKTKSGHRKILALFLVDPAIPVVSTANVPPQQRNWWRGEQAVRESGRLPPEIADMVLRNVDFPIDEEDAKALRDELMSERSGMQAQMGRDLTWTTWSFCEH